MNKTIISIIFFLTLNVFCKAEEIQIENFTPKISNNNSLYWHPVSLLPSIFLGASYLHSIDPNNNAEGGTHIPFGIYFTYEIFAAPFPFIIRPSAVWNFFSEESESKDFRIGSDFGVRFYLFRYDRGPYIQPQLGIFYYSEKPQFEKTKRGIWFDGLLYAGTSFRIKRDSNIKLFIDAGLGFCYSPKRNNSRMPSPHFDINFGIGYTINNIKNNQQK